MRVFVVLCLFTSFSAISLAAEISPSWSYAQKKLQAQKFSKSFIQALQKSYEPEEFKNCLELNVLLYLRKSDDHGIQVTDEAVMAINSFVAENKQTFASAEKKYGVPGSVVASLMWIESRFGKNSGTFHVPSVYLHLIQARRPEVLKYLKHEGPARFSESPSKADLKKIPARTKTKAEWAFKELAALQKIYRRRGNFALSLRGSFSGAFGIPQFLPSSYVSWATPQQSGQTPDLEKPEDAIFSVANYLKKNGWKKTKPKTHILALMHYNNSKDYADAILGLSRKIRSASANPNVPGKSD